MTRLGLAVLGIVLCGAVAWFGFAFPMEAVLVGLVALVAAATGFPLGATCALLAAIADYVSRTQHAAGDPLAGALCVLVPGVAVSALFYGEMSPIEELSEIAPGQLAFRPATQRALPRGDAVNGSAMSTSLSALASGIREVSQGDFTKNIAVSDGQLQDLAIAINKLTSECASSSCGRCTERGQPRERRRRLHPTASTALAVIEGAAVAQGRLDRGIQEQSRIVDQATSRVVALTEAISIDRCVG